MPRAFLVKKTRGTSLYKSEPDYDTEHVETSGSKSIYHNDPRRYCRDMPDGRKDESDITDQKTNVWKKHYFTSHDETTTSTSSNLPQYPHQSNIREFAEPIDLSQAKPILLASSNSAFEYVEPSMRASQASLNNHILNTNISVEEPLDLQIRPPTDRDLPQSSVTEVSSASSRPASLYNPYASYQKRLGHNPASALYSYMIEGTSPTRTSPFRDASFYQYSDWNHGRSDRDTAQFSKEEQMMIPLSPNQSPTMPDYYNTSPSYYLDKYILPTDTNNDKNIQEIQTEQQMALNLSPSKEDQLKMSPQLPNSDRFVFNHTHLSRRSKNQGHVLKHSARQPILGLEYIQNTPNSRDSKSPDGESSHLLESQDQEADGCMQLDQAVNCSSEQQHTGYSSTETTSVSGGKSSPSKVDKPSQYKKYICDICGKGFSRSNTLVTHKRIHTGDKPFTCELCGRAFRQPGNLTRHRLTHTTVKPYVCQQCGKAFNRASNLHTHMRTHTNYKPFTCQYCGKGFHQKIDMKIHSYTHTGEKPHKCKKCGRGFKQLTHLTYHLRTHSDVKMYTCAYCGKGFNQKGNLQAHIYGHTGERPYHCEVCSKGFTLASTLNTHRRTHADKKPYACQYCGKDFYQKNALKSHMIASHPYTGDSLL
ncbi:zinc finger protein 239-like [Patiria miniata]|uniref:C2H2-type domain-containing protein n=1 Tax=Patiria miniata TaxID=46514 RepID=A0A913ZLA3_PATMI|nr:zinc finger protein 239-like [Patiria miniata]XP_038052589.1 zinc finger protein 239-like [Patiria miniata]XP_038052590.1 zinc finger protein 239-like [Patiria miniata]XP_038052591.1 zinc finger protein 239-like [Patiria miniata]